MSFLLPDLFLSVFGLATIICFIKIIVSACIFQYAKEHTIHHRQTVFLLPQVYGQENTLFMSFSLFYKYDMIRSICKKESRGESDEEGPYFPMMYI
ncbi:hypothetical protein [Bacillus thuringiensis]|uniref:hypothetical protein n=1 Tax=Bacillus thuringiensis TaxID=1428 RepID=UPI003B981159